MKPYIQTTITTLLEKLGDENPSVSKKFYIGKTHPIKAAIVFLDGVVDKDVINQNLLNPLMHYVNEDLRSIKDLPEYILEMHIPMANTLIERDLSKVIYYIKRGHTALFIDEYSEFIIIDTKGTKTRNITEPESESVLRGSREGFIEDININISLIRKRIKDNNLRIQFMQIGRRSQTDLALIFIEGIANPTLIEKLQKKISDIDVDYIAATGELEQYLDRYTYTLFPQFNGTERIDKVEASLMEGRVAIILDGTPYVISIPSIFVEFFQAPEDYYQKTIPSTFLRLLRFLAAIIVITLDPLYLTLVKSNNEFIPIKFIIPIAQAREGIALSIFTEILALDFIVELLREGGLRLPSKIAQTMALVGGIIIGDTAIDSKIVSPTTLFIVGVSTICTFLIVDYNMSLAIRLLKFPMLILSFFLGIFGIAVGWYLILFYLCTLENFDVPYFSFKKDDLKDSFIRLPLNDLYKRPEAIPNKDTVRKSIPKDTDGDTNGE